MNELVTGGATAFAGGVIGYLVHVAQETFTRKNQQQDDDTVLMKELHGRLVELRDADTDHRDVAKAVSQLESEAVMLRHAKLRNRVISDLRDAGQLWIVPAGGASPRDKQNVWIRDALDALAAVARGERLPERSDEYITQLFFVERTARTISAGLEPLMTYIQSIPEAAALQQERARWEAERRARQGWRGFFLRRRPRRAVPGGTQADRQAGDARQQSSPM
ncbi:hypothetical protein [Streptomyces anulatus]|uniref:hypothetical protein n=1 Tax=Streptomyces anulatus TaxID=1892 RepID=UPI0038707F5E|nr:hypothetical protein OG238_40725 [Streptomyces anulatus]WSW80772.1 hypothetical protein OG536_00220 [Streptomyces anulatus]